MTHVADNILAQLEQQHVGGISSSDILAFLASQEIRFGEATLRKWVQLGLLPRSIRVGTKGKHRGSKGKYPIRVIRRILRIRELMAENLTIEEIQRQFLFVRGDIEALEQTLDNIFTILDRMQRERGPNHATVHAVGGDLSRARTLAGELLAKLEKIEQRFISEARQPARAEVAAS